MGDGQSIHIWDDPWLPRPNSFQPFIRRDGAPTLVRELLLPELSWNSDFIAQWFEPEDVALILSIPLNQRSIPSASNPSPIVETWKRIWNAGIPGKVKVHMWKVCASILPTVAQLRTKRIWITDGCVFCNDGDESIHHVSRDCSFVHAMLRKVPSLSSVISSSSDYQASMLDWLSHSMQTISSELFDFLLYLLWAVWKERNQRVWNGKNLDLEQLFFQAASSFSLFTSLHPGRSPKIKRASAPLGASSDRNFVSYLLVIEALPGKAACAWAVEFNQSPNIFESDCLQLVNSLKSEEEDHSMIGRVVDDILVHLTSIPSSFFQHVYKESNLEAHKLAKLALYSNVFANWKGSIPSTIRSLVASYCNTSSH
ncbi:uncharacterized protein LOC133726892 [Rosa rugosa]|uniref:uncharacterized protein LOC133726892 n=1 Tax=Rosa rugosa TaxID=74645 RepID=UPI002B411963|nr:uncharacterized protein LOC133726892 [Rosa rugosa]